MLTEPLAAGARTVSDIAQHFVGLQQSARSLLAQHVASQRGYFTPTEDEEVRHLLVSYWQARNALHELVYQLKDDSYSQCEHRSATFLVAFSAALVLIDAARFLRENVHDRGLVRAKLNEPEPHFGIPAGVYDAVQASLASPNHVWHLYHAVQYFNEHQEELRSVGRDEQLAPLMEIIDRLQSRLQVSIQRYALARLRLRTRQVWTVVHRDTFHRALYGLQKAAGEIASHISVRPTHRPQLPATVVDQLRELLRPGDVLLTRKEHALTNYFLPGFWPHAALFLGTPQQLERLGIAEHIHVAPRWRRLLECDATEPRRVLEAMKDGVLIRSLASPCGADAICVLRPQLAVPEIAAAIARGLFHEGKSYDFDFDFSRSDRLVCSEVVYRSYDGIGDARFQLTRRAGRLTLAPQDLVGMALRRATFATFAVFCPQHASELLTGAEAEICLRATQRDAIVP
jgi:hypothetical protein